MLTKSITTKVAALCGAALIPIAMAAPASAVVIFSDDFNRSHATDVGNNWVETEQGQFDVRLLGNRMRIRDDNPLGSAERLISTAVHERLYRLW